MNTWKHPPRKPRRRPRDRQPAADAIAITLLAVIATLFLIAAFGKALPQAAYDAVNHPQPPITESY